MIVMKFGGSSVESAAAITRVVGHIEACLSRRPAVVVSAMAKTTRQLLAAGGAAAAGDLAAARALAAEIRAYHQRESAPVTAPGALDGVFESLFGELDAALIEAAEAGALTPRLADRIAGYGELLSSAILAEALRFAGIAAGHVDCRRVLVTDDRFTRAQPLYDETDARLREALLPLVDSGRVAVLGGYVGATRDGVTTTLGYEGSDFSAAIVGAALAAEEVQIWTDVDGILTADPNLVPGARVVPFLSFGEALELACSGSKKPHPGTLGPARRKGVPIRVLNSRRPQAPGTLIGPRPEASRPAGRPAVKSIACRAHDHLLYALPAPSHAGNGFRPGVFALCERFQPSLMVLGATAAGVPLALDRADRLAEVRAAFGALAEVGELGVVPGRTAVTLVSDDLATNRELAERVLAALAELAEINDFEPRLVLEGVAAPNVRLLVEPEQAGGVVARLHEALLEEGPGA
ncbi:MAG TPA: aspartate kinase [Thermoanaerobaculia bacterium]|nr:aspartate kinase [Thermoanaerobaculia bacterium]